jgi:acyl carrier protein
MPSPHLPIYLTGDLARWLPDGNIEFLGRIDHQVKIRGFRIESSEIENHLLNHEKIKEAIVLAAEDNNEKYLCAYLVAKTGETKSIQPAGLRDYLSNRLPDYMVPAYFVMLEKIPLTPSGKVDRKALPAPGIEKEKEYLAPRDTFEKKLVGLWSDILEVEKEKISINDNFFHLGGHSLKATVLASRIHKEFNINVSLSKIFKTPHIRGLASHIKETARNNYLPVEPVEKKDYYPLSSAQKRLFFLQQMDERGIGYHIPSVWEVEGQLDEKKFESIFHGLIRRHESMKTFFMVVNDEPVQRVRDESVIAHWSLVIAEARRNAIKDIIKNFIKPFDLSQAPLLRVELIKIEQQKHILMVDMHHIISDGLSTGIFVKEFMELYAAKRLPQLKLQYKDYGAWQHRNYGKKYIKEQEIYWVKQFDGKIPVLNLPTDYSRPVKKDFAGNFFGFHLPGDQTTAVKELAVQQGATMNMVLLALFNILLWKLSGQKDIVVGMATAGRQHQDLEHMLGVFINMIAIRSFPRPDITFLHYLKEIIKITLKAYDNQDYPFEDLVSKLVDNRPINRHPLFDVSFGMQNLDIPGIEIPGLKLKPYQYDISSSRFDLTMLVFELEDRLYFNMEYDTNLFKKGTIEGFSQYYQRIIDSVIRNPQQLLKEIEIISEEENVHLLSFKEENKSIVSIDFEI